MMPPTDQEREALQARVDAQAYPPTMQYELGRYSRLEPGAILKSRLAKISPLIHEALESCPTNYFLDVGCNKGFFSLTMALGGYRVEGLDISRDCVQLCRDIFKAYGLHGQFWPQSFREWIPPHRYGVVFLGNVHHYIFKECDGWDWLAKLAAITETGGMVILEGPFGMECKDMAPVLTDPEQQALFTWENFLDEASYVGLGLVEKVPSGAYTPDRYVAMFRKDGLDRDEFPIQLIESLHSTKVPVRVEPGRIRVYADGEMAIKLTPKPIQIREEIRLEIGSASLVSNGMVGIVTDDDGEVLGWVEQLLHETPLKYFEREKEVLKEWAKHNLFCLHNGFVDEDPGTINWMPSLTYFDKNSLIPAQRITKESTGRTMQCLQQSFHLSDEFRARFEADWLSKDPQRLEALFTFIKEL